MHGLLMGYIVQIVELVKTTLIPGSIQFLIIGLIVGVLLLHGRGRVVRLGRVWVTVLATIYLILSFPVGPGVLVWGLTRGFTPITTASDAAGATAVVVLAGGSGSYRDSDQRRALELISTTSALRVLEAARVYRTLADPLVITSGGIVAPDRQTSSGATLLKNALITLGVPANRIVPETDSLNTREHAILVTRLLHAYGVDRFVLVTSPTHILRAMRAFENQGVHPVPSTSAMQSGGPGPGLGGWGPSTQNLRISQQAIHDYFGLAYYWTRGWL